MSVFDDELILPGVITDIKSDYSTGYDTSAFGTTDAVTIIGTAFDGPVGRPVQIYSPEHARYIFGSAFDFTTRREATLVAEIQEAWDTGCRTIYAVRVSGQEIYKDFQLASDVDCKLRVSGIFPSNANKNVYFEYDAVDTLSEIADGSEATIKIYKPSSRATIEEKMLGKVVNEKAILVNTVKLNSSWNISANTRLVDFIKLFNEYRYNNVLKLSLVDGDGNDITDTSLAQGIAFGDMFAGFYFIGRDRNASKMIAKTEMDVQFVTEENREKIYENFSGNIFKTLKVNTDITKDLPIYHKDVTQLNRLIDKVDGITMIKLFDFLEVAGKADLLWLKDKVDYEEVDLSDFEMYKRLGSGFATTAKIAETKEGTGVYKVSEVTNNNDVNRVAGITDGIYSMLENLRSDYRVLAGKYADVEIKGKLPKKAEFLTSNPQSASIFAETVRVQSKLKEKDLSTIAKSYKFELHALDEDAEILSKDTVIESLYTKNEAHPVLKYAYEAESMEKLNPKEFEAGDLIICKNVMHRATGKGFEKMTDLTIYKSDFNNQLVVTSEKIYQMDSLSSSTLAFTQVINKSDIEDAKYLCVDVNGKAMIFEVVYNDVTIKKIKLVATLDDILEESSSVFVTIVPTIKENAVERVVTVQALNLEATNLGELIISMNENKELNELFSFDLDPSLSESVRYIPVLSSGVLGESSVFEAPSGQETLVDTESNKVGAGSGNDAIVDRGLPVYDKNLYIPYKTTDNFARHLAQHCIYTGLKTAPTHGIIGCSKLTTNNLKTIAERVNRLVNLDLNLYAKRPNGNDMLDKNNLPYPIGRGVSVTFFQTNVETGDNYTYISPGASAYAGMVSTLSIDQSSTSQPIDIPGTSFELTNYQLGRLTQAGYVTVKNSYTQGYVITDGVTMAPATSPFRRLSVARIVNGIDEAIRAAAEPFIGKQNHLANRNSLQTAIKSQLDNMLEQLIERYDFKLVTDTANDRLGVIEIEYIIVPIYEIREIRNRLSVKDNQ